MSNQAQDASDCSVQEIAVNDRNPITEVQETSVAIDGGGNGIDAQSQPEPEPKPEPPTTPPADQPDEWEMVYDGASAFTKRGPGQPLKTGNGKTSARQIVKIALDRLLAHPLNEKLYGATKPNEIRELADSLGVSGQISPLVVTADLQKIGFYTLLSGHKRAEAMKKLGWNEADCQEADVEDADERIVCLLEANRQHKPTTEQNVRIGEVYFELETKKAKARQVAGAKAKNGGRVVEVFTQPTPPPAKTGEDASGKARDIAAAKVGMSGVSFDKGRKVVKAIDKAQQDGHAETGAELRHLLNEKGIDPAHARADVLHLIEKARKSFGTGGEPKANRTQAKGSDKPQCPVPAVLHPPEHESDPLVAGADAVATKADAGAEAVDDASMTGTQSGAPTPISDDDDPPVVGIIAASTKVFEQLEALEVADLSISQKGNLYRALELVANWLANHDEMLQGSRKA